MRTGARQKNCPLPFHHGDLFRGCSIPPKISTHDFVFGWCRLRPACVRCAPSYKRRVHDIFSNDQRMQETSVLPPPCPPNRHPDSHRRYSCMRRNVRRLSREVSDAPQPPLDHRLLEGLLKHHHPPTAPYLPFPRARKAGGSGGGGKTGGKSSARMIHRNHSKRNSNSISSRKNNTSNDRNGAYNNTGRQNAGAETNDEEDRTGGGGGNRDAVLGSSVRDEGGVGDNNGGNGTARDRGTGNGGGGSSGSSLVSEDVARAASALMAKRHPARAVHVVATKKRKAQAGAGRKSTGLQGERRRDEAACEMYLVSAYLVHRRAEWRILVR